MQAVQKPILAFLLRDRGVKKHSKYWHSKYGDFVTVSCIEYFTQITDYMVEKNYQNVPFMSLIIDVVTSL